MSTEFSIGDMSKITNISIQTLRHYDKIGLLKPSYVNEKSRYRYYSVKHLVRLDLIKQCKAMGLSLNEIKNIINNYTSFDSILDVLTKQKSIIDKKIDELSNIKNNIIFLEDRIKDALNEGMNEVFIKHNEERSFIRYDSAKRYTDEFEINLSKLLSNIEKQQSFFNRELAFVTSYKDLKNNCTLDYNNMLISFTDNIDILDDNKVILPKGNYLTLNFDDDYTDTKKYYKKVMDYIQRENIAIEGDFYEIYIITRVGNDGKEKSLGKIEILLSEE